MIPAMVFLKSRAELKNNALEGLSLQVLLFLTYFGMGKLCDLIASEAGFASLLWVPSGIALAGLLRFGQRLWPAVALAGFAISLNAGAGFLASVAIGSGNALEALIGVTVLRSLKFDYRLTRVADVFKFFLAAIVFGPPVSALIGASSLWISDVISAASFIRVFIFWWAGDSIGILLICPLFLIPFETVNFNVLRQTSNRTRLRILEAALLIIFSFFLGELVFNSTAQNLEIRSLQKLSFLFPALVWAAIRFKQLGATLILTFFSAYAVWKTAMGVGPFATPDLQEGLANLQSYVALACMTTLYIAAVISERETIEIALRESKARAGAVFESAMDAFVSVSAEGKILDCNTAAEITFRKSRASILGKNMQSFLEVGPDWNPQHRALEGNQRYKTLAQRGPGAKFPVEVSISRVIHITPPLYTIFVRDISEQLNSELRLREQAENLSRSNAELEQFATLASHDLKEPLRTISVWLGYLKKSIEDKLSSEDREHFQFCIEASNRMQAMIDAILSYSSAGRREVVWKDVNSEAELRRVIAMMESDCEKSGAKIHVGKLPVLKADPHLLAHVFQNLISNALKFRRQEHPEILVSSREEDDRWVFSVQDNGIGFDAKQSDRIFKLFQRLHGNGEYQGSGIGLALCKKMIEKQNGKIWAESEPGQGAVFNFSLPKIQTEVQSLKV